MDLSRLALRSALIGRTAIRGPDAGNRIWRARRKGGLHQGIDSGVALISAQVGSTSAIGCEGLHQSTNSFLWTSMRETKEAIIFCSATCSASAGPDADCRCALSADTTAVSISAAGTRAMTPAGGVVIPRKYGCDT